jgi:hypothetical protein
MYGYGYSLYNRLAFLSQPLDPEAEAFLTATGITDSIIKSAINTLCLELKTYGVWNKMKAIYPFVGGTATTHKFNLKDSRDLDAAFRLAFNGGWTHNSNGVTPNGVNAFANTFFNTSTNLIKTSVNISVYSRTNSNLGNAYEIGNSSNLAGTLDPTFLITRYSTNLSYIGIADASFSTSIASTDSRGFFSGGTNGSTTQKLFKNGSLIKTGTAGAGSLANQSLYISGSNNAGNLSTASNKQLAFATIGDGLTDDDSANLYYSVQKFQTTLGRQVGTPIYSSNATDVNARLFLGATNIQDATITSAVDTLVQGLKTDGVWSKLKAVYPFVGGTATTHKFNLANALDEDSAFRLAFSGGWTHSSNGALPNGTNGYANTFLNFKTILNVNSHSFGIYSRTQDVSIPAKLYGCFTGSNYLQQNVSVGDFISGAISNQLLYTPSPTTGLMLASRTTSTLFKAFRNNILLGTKTTSVVDIPTANFYFGARNENNITQASYNPYQHAFSFIGDGLTDTEASNLYTRVQAFQTTLNRQV